MKKFVFGLSIILIFFSCKNSKVATKESPSMNNFKVLYLSEYGGLGHEAQEVVIQPQIFEQKWNELVNAYSETEKTPEVDFSKNMVVFKYFQGRNSGGATYEIQSVNQVGDNTEIIYKINSPSDMATQAITSPMMILSVPRTKNLSVKFKLN